MIRTRSTAAAALLAVLTLVLGACTLPRLPGQDGPDLAEDDLITLTHAAAGMYGFFGVSYTQVGADSITPSYVLPNETEIYSLTEEITEEGRELIEESAEEYLAWAQSLSEEERHPCTDIAATTVKISGSITHESSAQDCMGESPLRMLEQSVRSAQTSLPGQLAHPTSDWTVEIRPWGENGPDEAAPVERYRLSSAQHEIGMGITAQNAPAGWGAGLAADTGEGSPLGWDVTGAVLIELNAFLIGQDQLGCEDQTGEIRVIHEGTPSSTWTYRLCPGQQSEALVEVLRGL